MSILGVFLIVVAILNYVNVLEKLTKSKAKLFQIIFAMACSFSGWYILYHNAWIAVGLTMAIELLVCFIWRKQMNSI